MSDVDVFGLPLIVKPYRPLTGGWRRVDVVWDPARAGGAIPYVIEKYYNRGQELQVITAIERVKPDSEVYVGSRAEFHVSVTGLKWMAPKPYRVSESRARWALKQFGFDGYHEDNHVPDGLARNFWRPLEDRYSDEVCACIAREPAVKTMKGDYTWRA